MTCAPECPATVAATVTLPTADLTGGLGEGEHTFNVTATDRAGNATTKTKTFIVDHTEPDITVGGSLNDATLDDEDLNYNASYELTVDAGDPSLDSDAVATAGVTRLELLVDGVSQQTKTQDCPEGNCSLQTAWTLNTGNFARGAHDLDIVATDAAGNDAVKRISWKTYAYPAALPSVTRDMNGATRIDGAAAGDGAGMATAPAGDVDDDGYDDLLLGAPRADALGRSDAGSVYLVRGVAAGGAVDLASAGAVLLRIDGAKPGELAGSSVATIGDVNGDDVDDWAIGAPATTQVNGSSTRGTVYVVFGRQSGDVDLANLGSDGYRIIGPSPAAVTLPSLTAPAPMPFGAVLGGEGGGAYERTGDVNGDQTPDLVIGASAESNGLNLAAGKAYVVYGKAGSEDVDVTQMAGRGFTIAGGGLGFEAGYSVAIPGDLNGDDLADVAVSQPGGGPTALSAPTRAGSIAVVYGSAAPTAVTLNNSMPAASGYVLNGAAGNALTGTSGDRLTAVGSIGDVNGDNRLDLGYAGALSGAIYARSSGTPVLRAPADGFWATQNVAATSVNGIGDVNDDDEPDLAVGSPERTATGTANVVYGRPEKADLGPIDAIGGHEGQQLTAPAGASRFGATVDGADDFDGDLVDDLVIAAPAATANGRNAAGSAWVLPGTPQPFTDTDPEAVAPGARSAAAAGGQSGADHRFIRLGTAVNNALVKGTVAPGLTRFPFDAKYQRRAGTLFDSFTLENEMKMNVLWAGGSLDAQGKPVITLNPDARAYINSVIKFAKDHSMSLRGHTLLFASADAVPGWLKDRQKGANPYTPTQVQDLVQAYIMTVMNTDTWRRDFDTWDVVNEPLLTNGAQLKTPGNAPLPPDGHPDDGFWYKYLGGEDWVNKAFKWAHDADPGAKLFLNETSFNNDPGTDTRRVVRARELLQGAANRIGKQPIGFGFQMHFDPNFGDKAHTEPSDFKGLWKRFISVKGKSGGEKPLFEITEMDYAFDKPYPKARIDFTTRHYDADKKRLALDDPRADAQMVTFDTAALACETFKRCKRMTVWGVSDKYTFKDDGSGRNSVQKLGPGECPGQPDYPGTNGTVGCGSPTVEHRLPLLLTLGGAKKRAYRIVARILGQCTDHGKHEGMPTRCRPNPSG